MVNDISATIKAIVVGVIDNSFKTVSKIANTSMQTMTKVQKRYNDITKKGTATTYKFNAALLSTMFFGMGIQRVFGGLLGPASQLFGIMDIWGTTLQVVFLPVMEQLFNVLLPIMTAFMDMPEPLKIVIGVITLVAAVFGTVLGVISAIGLGVASFSAGMAVIVTGISGVVAFLGTLIGIIIAIFTAPITLFIIIGIALGVLIALIIMNFDKILSFLGTIVTWIGNTFKKAWDGLITFFSGLWDGIKSGIKIAWDWILEVLKSPIELIKTAWNGITTFFSGLWDGVKNVTSTAWNGIWGVIKGVVNLIIDGFNIIIGGWNKLSFKAPDWVPLIGGKNFSLNIPTIPKLAEGGIVNRPTLAMIGEAGPEAVVPLGKRGMGAGGLTINQTNYITGSMKDEVDRMIKENNRNLVDEIRRLTGVRG